MTLEAIGEKILVKQISAERVTEGGIVIPDPEANKYDQRGAWAVIESIGSTAFREGAYVENDLNIPHRRPQVGEKVLIGRYAGTLLTKDGEKYRLLNDQDILAVLRDEESDHGRWQVA